MRAIIMPKGLARSPRAAAADGSTASGVEMDSSLGLTILAEWGASIRSATTTRAPRVDEHAGSRRWQRLSEIQRCDRAEIGGLQLAGHSGGASMWPNLHSGGMIRQTDVNASPEERVSR